MMPNTDPNKVQTVSNVGELALLIQLMGSINSGIETLKGLMQTANNTNGLVIEQLITIRGELKKWQEDTLNTRAFRSDIDIQTLEAKDREYDAELKKIQEAQQGVQTALENIKSGRGQTQEKMKAIATEISLDVVSKDKIDLRGVKISSKQFTILIIGVVLITVLLIIFLPDSIAEILTRLAGMIGNGQP